jgi:hypothetical protein
LEDVVDGDDASPGALRMRAIRLADLSRIGDLYRKQSELYVATFRSYKFAIAYQNAR